MKKHHRHWRPPPPPIPRVTSSPTRAHTPTGCTLTPAGRCLFTSALSGILRSCAYVHDPYDKTAAHLLSAPGDLFRRQIAS